MYIIKNAWTNIIRGKGRNILIGFIIVAVTISTCIAITINKSATKLVNKYKNNNPIEVSFRMNMMNLKDASDEDKNNFDTLSEEDIKKYGDSSLVKDYYYTNEVSLSSNSIEAVSYDNVLNNNEDNKKPDNMPDDKMNVGDFRLTGYSDPSYIDNFINGTNKIKEGKMFDKNNKDKVIVISEELAEENNLKVGDKVSFYNNDDEDTTYEFEIVGIYENTSEDEDNFMGMNAMNSSNQIYTNITSVNEINQNNTNKMKLSLSAKFYLNSNSDLKKFEKEVRKKGLSDYYEIMTNEEEALESLKPVSNLKDFSKMFLIIILIVGSIILSVINLINIRERKYEIGVLRAIGMSKLKVSLQLICEIFIVAMISLIIGTTVGKVTSQPITNKILANEISSYQNEENNITQNFGSSDFKRPGFDENTKNRKQNVEYVDSLKVNVDIYTVLQLFLVSILLTTISSFISIMLALRYEPNKILQNR